MRRLLSFPEPPPGRGVVRSRRVVAISETVEVTVTHLSGPEQGMCELFNELPLVVGRSATGHIHVDHHLVSTRHVEVDLAEGNQLRVRDLGSTNGVLVDGARVEGSTVVPSGSVLELGAGGPRLRVELDPEAFSVSFNQLRRQTARRERGDLAPLLSTEEALDRYMPSSPSDSARDKLRSLAPPPGANKLYLILALVAAAGAVALFLAIR